MDQQVQQPSTKRQWGKPFQKGKSGNPNGRPPALKYQPDCDRLRPLSDETCEKLAEMMRGYRTAKKTDPKTRKEIVVKEVVAPAIQLSACEIILERAWGKAPQALHIRNETPDEIDDEKGLLEAIQSRLNGIAARIGAAGVLEFTDIEPAS